MFGKREKLSTPATLVPLNELPAFAAANRKLEDILARQRTLEEELKAARTVPPDPVADVDAWADALLCGRDPLAAIATAPPPGRAVKTIEAELAAASRAVQIQELNISKTRRAAILAELDKKEHRQALEAIAEKIAEHLDGINEAHDEANRYFEELISAGYRELGPWGEEDPKHFLDDLGRVLITQDSTLHGRQSWLRAMALRLVETGLVAAKHPIVAKLQKRL
jgi:hypothetical protein